MGSTLSRQIHAASAHGHFRPARLGLNTTREAIYTAFFNLLTGITVNNLNGAPMPLKFTSRHLRTVDDIVSLNQPALMISQRGETSLARTGLPYNWRFDLDIWIFYRVQTLIPVPTPATVEKYSVTIINEYMDAVEAALDVGRASGQGKQSLGGLVTDARLEGMTEFDDGRVDDQAVIRIPAVIIADR